MAQFQLKGMSDFLKELNDLASVEMIGPKMLEEAALILQEKMVEKSPKDTGAMAASIRPTKPTRGKDGYEIIVRPTGKDKKGTRNMEKMIYLEYGVRGRPARPIVKSATIEAEAAVFEKMRQVFSREVLRR